MKVMKNKKGYTLVELIITLAIIGIMLVPIFNAFLESNRVNLRSRRQISAVYLAQNKLEDIKGMTRTQFNVLDIDSSDSIGIDHDDWVYDLTVTDDLTTSNGGTTFDLKVHIENVTNELGISLKSPTGSNQTNERTWHSRIVLSDEVANIAIESTERNEYAFTSGTRVVNLVFNKNDANYSNLVVNGETYSMKHTDFIDPDNTWIRKIFVNVVGYEGLSEEWHFNITNNTDYAVDVKPYDDKDGKIKLAVGPTSRSSIYIGNALPRLSGEPSTSKEWYNVVITVSHNGSEYEVIESTVGK